MDRDKQLFYNNIFHNNRKQTEQIIYDSYNNLVFSDDTKVIQKMITKINLYNQIKHLNGDILEFGVFKGHLWHYGYNL